MNLSFDFSVAQAYKSQSQIARVLTEDWISQNMYCPRCGNLKIEHMPNNSPVADFICPVCNNQYELKSKSGKFGHKINDGAYETMIKRITSNTNPDFLFMSYEKDTGDNVKNLIFVPKHFFVPEIIERRKPLADNARRHGWVGCNILVDKIPLQGRIAIIDDSKEIPSKEVIQKANKSLSLENDNIKARSWMFDVLNCVNKINKYEFTLNEIYSFEEELKTKHPNNNNVRAKIRQQLQILRDKNFIYFLGNGIYRKVL